MFRNLFSVTGFILLSSTVISAQTKLLEKVEKKGSEIIIPYEKHQLSNGLTLLIHEDHSDPIVHVDVTYHVGSAREEVGKSGFAHFFEHMMFQGSLNVGDEQHFKIVTESGGTLNGTTNLDRTNYFETLPANQLEVALWLEADRMGFLLDSVTQQKFEIQRSTVKNERGQNYDNRPYGLVGEKTGEALYPYGHPYSWTTIGYIEDLNRSDVNDLKKFFMRWYGPNNATLTVAGDVKPAEVIKLAEKYFGSIPRGPVVKMPEKKMVTLESDRYISYEDNIRFPLLAISYPTVHNYHADEAALDILSEILGGGKNSIFYKNFVKAQKALQANVSHPCSELAGSISISVAAYPGKTLAEMEQLVREAFTEFEKRGVTDDDLLRYKATHESDVISSLESVRGKGSMLAAYQTFTGNPNYIREDITRYDKVTKEDIMRVYNKYIKGKGAVFLSVVPKGKTDIVAKPDNFKQNKEGYTPPADEYKGLSYTVPKDNFDRSKKPGAGPNPVIKVPAYWTENFANGIKVIGSKNSEVPFVTIQLSIEAGNKMESFDPSKRGVAQLMTSLLNESSQKTSAEDISSRLERLGSSISFNSSDHYITLSVSSLTKNLDATLALAEERLFNPKFDSAEFARAKKQQLESIANQGNQPTVIANNVYGRLLYGEGSFLAVPSVGTTETVGSLTLDDIKKYYNTYLSPSISNLVIVGDVEKDAVLSKLGYLKNWKAKEVKLPAEPQYPVIDKTRLYLVDKENAPQSEVRIGYLALRYDATGEYYKTSLMNFPLGGAFNSRINVNLREAKGWTYGARCNFGGDKWTGTFTASGGIRGDATDSSIVEFMKEIRSYAEKGITDAEISFMKSSIGQNDALRYETGSQKAAFLRRIIAYNLDKTFIDKQNEILKNITKSEIDALAKKLLPADKMIILVVGDKKKIKDGLMKLGYEVVELDKEGKKVQ